MDQRKNGKQCIRLDSKAVTRERKYEWDHFVDGNTFKYLINEQDAYFKTIKKTQRKE